MFWTIVHIRLFEQYRYKLFTLRVQVKFLDGIYGISISVAVTMILYTLFKVLFAEYTLKVQFALNNDNTEGIALPSVLVITYYTWLVQLSGVQVKAGNYTNNGAVFTL